MGAFKVDDNVLVPRSKILKSNNDGFALRRCKVDTIRGRKIRVRLEDGESSEWLDKSAVHRDVGILILSIGEFSTERSLLDPLAKSVKQFLRLLVDDSSIESIRVRSLNELGVAWSNIQKSYTHIIMIGHGNAESLSFGVDGNVAVSKIAEKINIRCSSKKVFLSLCCQSGDKPFAEVLSSESICRVFIGPHKSVNGAIASQFCQSFFTLHLLSGQTTGVAFRNARTRVTGSSGFRMWKNGKRVK